MENRKKLIPKRRKSLKINIQLINSPINKKILKIKTNTRIILLNQINQYDKNISK